MLFITGKRTTLLLLLLGGSISLFAFWKISTPNMPLSSQLSEEVWHFPKSIQQKDFQLFYGKLRSRQPWNDKNVFSDSKEQTDSGIFQAELKNWQLVGITREGGKYYALLLNDAKKVKRYQQGDALSDDVKLMEVYPSHIKISQAEQVEIKRLFSK